MDRLLGQTVRAVSASPRLKKSPIDVPATGSDNEIKRRRAKNVKSISLEVTSDKVFNQLYRRNKLLDSKSNSDGNGSPRRLRTERDKKNNSETENYKIDEYELQNPPTNQIVSILKKKEASESGSSSNVSPVTFSVSVQDTPTRKSGRQGILKKRSSLDESRYRSMSPDEKSILVRNTRRNSLGETQHGILKQQRNSENGSQNNSDATPVDMASMTPIQGLSEEPQHGILKHSTNGGNKRDDISSPDPNETPKHVSISQAVILAVAEMCYEDEFVNCDNELDVKPILKSDHCQTNNGQNHQSMFMRPILKKKYSSENEESIRPILKTSRKSSREENHSDNSDVDCMRSILKSDLPPKRLSTSDTTIDKEYLLQQCCFVSSPVSPSDVTTDSSEAKEKIDIPLISVAERIKNMETFLTKSPTSEKNGAVPKVTSTGRRTLEKSRFKTQPVTVDEFSR